MSNTYDCGCPKPDNYYERINQGSVSCETCGYLSCLDCHHIDSTPAKVADWKCYEGHGCNKGDAQ